MRKEQEIWNLEWLVIKGLKFISLAYSSIVLGHLSNPNEQHWFCIKIHVSMHQAHSTYNHICKTLFIAFYLNKSCLNNVMLTNITRFWHNFLKLNQLVYHLSVLLHWAQNSWMDSFEHSSFIVSTKSCISIQCKSWSFSLGKNLFNDFSDYRLDWLHLRLKSLATLKICKIGNQSFRVSITFWTYFPHKIW